VTRPTASSIVERLVRRERVARTTDPQERRRVVLTLIPLGARHLGRARRSMRTWLAAVLTQLSLDELRQIRQGVALLEGAFQEALSVGEQS
jgi:DNA-binding MarR family transcriptional regulator